MSTLKSSAEDLTLNADGSGNDIIFQSNGSNVATLDQAGTLTATTFVGALTGSASASLPLAGGTMTGTLDVGVSDTGHDVKFHGATAGCKIFWDESADKLRVEGRSNGDDIFIVTDNVADLLNIKSTGIVFNEDGGDRDFRLEGQSNTHCVFFNGDDSKWTFGGSAAADGTCQINTDGASGGQIRVQRPSGVNKQIMAFYNGSTFVGEINTNTSSTTYATSSDYRLKENVDYDFDATTRLMQLKPARFNFISDDTNTLVDGFLAHEVSSIVPEAIVGDKDVMAGETFYTADDAETQGDNPTKLIGDIKTYSATEIAPQGIDQSKLVPLLVKTIQELEARITALEA